MLLIMPLGPRACAAIWGQPQDWLIDIQYLLAFWYNTGERLAAQWRKGNASGSTRSTTSPFSTRRRPTPPTLTGTRFYEDCSPVGGWGWAPTVRGGYR